MAILFKNRLSGKETATPERETFLSQWVVSEIDSEVLLNTVLINSGDFLIPNTNAHWALLNKENEQKQSGVFDKHLLPEDIEAVSIRAIGNALPDPNAGWLEWLDMSPLVPGMSERVELQPFERKIRKHIGHLEQIFRKPKAHLWTEIQRVLLSRARRIPHQAINYLAAHTEDWERPTLRGVLPKRILAMVTEDYWNISENQVAVRLIDHLHVYLNKRITEVRRLLNILKERNDYDAARGTFWLQYRIYELWGQAFDANAGGVTAERTLKELEHLKYKIAGLKDSFLYRKIPRRTDVPNTLKMTNIFANDPHYRYVAVLWKEWSKEGISKTKTIEQIYEEYQDLCRSFDRFCFLLTIRTFDQLKFKSSVFGPGTPIKKGINLPLLGSICEASVTWNDDGVISVEKDDSPVLRLIPLVSALGANPTENIVERHLDNISNAVPSDPLTIVLYLPSPEGRENRLPVEIQKRLHTIGNDLPQAQKKVGFLPVSPWEIGSVERVARAIRWVLWDSEFLKYPSRVPGTNIPEIVNLLQNLTGIRPVNNGRKYEVFRLLSDAEISAIDGICQGLKNNLKLLQDELSKLKSRNNIPKARIGQLKNEIEEVEEALIKFHSFRGKISQTCEYLNRLLICPVCLSNVNPWHNKGFQYDEKTLYSHVVVHLHRAELLGE